jgi:hypothetical protein
MIAHFHSLMVTHTQAEPVVRTHVDQVDMENPADLVRLFRGKLLDGQTFHTSLPHCPEIRVFCRRIGDTAAFATWLHKNSVHAVSVLLAGIDAAEDGGAINAIQSLRHHLPIPECITLAVARQERPLHAMFHRYETGPFRAPIDQASASIAAVFFGLLGASF